jgi:hypothetical protein
MEPPKAAKSGSHWLWWILLILVVGGVGYYFWDKSRSDSSMPMPPTGGLSPVSGFTAVKDRIEDEAEAHTSIWTRKLF